LDINVSSTIARRSDLLRRTRVGLLRVSAVLWTRSPDAIPSALGITGLKSRRPSPDAYDTFAFDGFGNLVARTGTTPNQYLYRGEALDAGTGMYYLRARWYRPALGRFLTIDKVETLIFNTSRYCQCGRPASVEMPGGYQAYTYTGSRLSATVLKRFSRSLLSK
jgi:RHS repeat-associated protein